MRGRVVRFIRRALFRYGWDTRCRHWEAVRLLRRATADGRGRVLDVGCGPAGIAAFLDVAVIGVDLEPPRESLPNREFTLGSIESLPFENRSFDHVACIDVIQDLSPQARARGVAELLRVARETVVITSPQGKVAERADAEFAQRLRSRGAAVPPWVDVALANPYPTAESVGEAVRREDPDAALSISYAEPVAGSRLVRAAAARSRVLYALVNVVLGCVMPALRRPAPERAYRMLVVARPGGRQAVPASEAAN